MIVPKMLPDMPSDALRAFGRAICRRPSVLKILPLRVPTFFHHASCSSLASLLLLGPPTHVSGAKEARERYVWKVRSRFERDAQDRRRLRVYLQSQERIRGSASCRSPIPNLTQGPGMPWRKPCVLLRFERRIPMGKKGSSNPDRKEPNRSMERSRWIHVVVSRSSTSSRSDARCVEGARERERGSTIEISCSWERSLPSYSHEEHPIGNIASSLSIPSRIGLRRSAGPSTTVSVRRSVIGPIRVSKLPRDTTAMRSATSRTRSAPFFGCSKKERIYRRSSKRLLAAGEVEAKRSVDLRDAIERLVRAEDLTLEETRDALTVRFTKRMSSSPFEILSNLSFLGLVRTSC